MTTISRKLVVMALIIVLTIGVIPGRFSAGIGGIPTVTAATNISNQDGIGYSGPIAGNEVVGTAFTGYQAWPSGFTKGSSAFIGSVYDGTSIWMIPYNADRLIKVNPITGEMTGYNDWPTGFTKGNNAFAGGVYDGTHIWLIPFSASQVIKVNVTTGIMTGYSNWPGGTRGADEFIGGTFDGTHIWLSPYSGNRLIKVDTSDGAMTSYESGDWPSSSEITLGSFPFAGAVFDGTSVWLIPYSASQLIKVDPGNGAMTVYNNWPSGGFNKSVEAFRGGVFDGTNIWLIPHTATHLVKMDTTTGLMTAYDDWPSGFSKESGSFSGGVYDGTNVWLVPVSASMLIKVNVATGDMTGYNDWSSGFNKGANSFMGGAYDGNNVWLIPFMADRLMKFGDSPHLKGLTLSSTTLSPTFSGEKMSYSANVGREVTSIDVMPTTEEVAATVTVNGSAVARGQAKAVALNAGDNTITIIVTSSLGNTKTYTVTVMREAFNVDLSGLTLSTGMLSPTFSAATTSYSASVGSGVTSVNITPTTADVDATMTVNGSAVTRGNTITTALSVGDNMIRVQVTAVDGNTHKNYDVTVTRATHTNNDNNGNNGNSGGTQDVNSTDKPTINLINGNAVNVGTITTSRRNEQTVTSVTVDPNKLVEMLKLGGERPVVMISVNDDSDVLIGELSGDMIRMMEESNAVLELKLGNASYRIPAQQINIDAIMRQAGTSLELKDIVIQVEISSPTLVDDKFVEDAARNLNLTLVVAPLNFTVRANYGDQQVEVVKFDAFIDRSIAIPDNIDPSRITTGVVIDPDGTIRHVPTKVVQQEGQYFVIINSLTNSTYSAIWNNVEFADVAHHWGKQAINDMGSRLVVQGTGEGLFSPDKPITRAEFAAIVVRGLGLKLDSEAAGFVDVKSSDWYSDAVRTARQYQLITGFEDGSFRPIEMITREQAMTIISKAMKLTGLMEQLPIQDVTETLQLFVDGEQVAVWAQSDAAACILAGIITGRSDATIAAKASITRAEVTLMLQQLLKKSGLI